MLARLLTAIALATIAGPALAASDLTVTFVSPPAPEVHENARYTLRVNNIGNQNAANVTLTIALPTTGSAPVDTILGIVGARSNGCNINGTVIVCALGTVLKNRNTTVFFDIALPYRSTPIAIAATAATTSSENSTANNSASHTVALTYVPTVIDTQAGPVTVENQHCSGTNLTSFFICTLFPSSLSAHTATFHPDGTITFPGEDPLYTGTWTQPNPSTLTFTYTWDGVPVASFFGRGVPGDCFEGVTAFGGTDTAGYEVCIAP